MPQRAPRSAVVGLQHRSHRHAEYPAIPSAVASEKRRSPEPRRRPQSGAPPAPGLGLPLAAAAGSPGVPCSGWIRLEVCGDELLRGTCTGSSGFARPGCKRPQPAPFASAMLRQDVGQKGWDDVPTRRSPRVLLRAAGRPAAGRPGAAAPLLLDGAHNRRRAGPCERNWIKRVPPIRGGPFLAVGGSASSATRQHPSARCPAGSWRAGLGWCRCPARFPAGIATPLLVACPELADQLSAAAVS